MTEGFTRVADATTLPPGALLQVRAEGAVLCLANVGGQVYAVNDQCPHERWALSRGYVDGDEIVCPGHGMLFHPANRTLNAFRVDPSQAPRYEVKVEDGGIWVARG